VLGDHLKELPFIRELFVYLQVSALVNDKCLVILMMASTSMTPEMVILASKYTHYLQVCICEDV
jgi:hypothetical protein